MSVAMPQRFGKYVLLRRIALGGMAEIFKAKVSGVAGFEKDLVVKRILPSFTQDPEFVRMFVDEARLTAKLQHPNIVQIFDFDEIDGAYYIGMEYIEGKDLKDVLEVSFRNRDPLTVTQCVNIAIDIVKGLSYAHTKEDRGEPLNIVHRDVTPSNVMISYNGDVKLMDFGIAKATQRNSTQGESGGIKGKVAYMAPEQAQNQDIDGRADLFAFGVMLWEMLVGRRLFLGENDRETIANVLTREVDPPSRLNRKVSPALDNIVMRCLERDVAKRYPSAEVLLSDLTRWYHQNTISPEYDQLKPIMLKLFRADIDAHEKASRGDEALMASFLAQFPEGTGMRPAFRGTNTNIPAITEVSRTIAAYPGGTGTGIAAHPGLGGKKKKKAPVGLAIGILAAAAGLGAVLAITSKKEEPPAPPPAVVVEAPKDARLLLKVEPHTAKLTVDGQAVSGEVKGLKLGDKVRVVAEADTYKRFEEIVSIDNEATVFSVQMERDGIPHQVVLKALGEKDTIFINDQKMGQGSVTYEGLLGERVKVTVEPEDGGAPGQLNLDLNKDVQLVDVPMPSQISVAVTPLDAKVQTSKGTVELIEGVAIVSGVQTGETIKLSVSAEGHEPVEKEIVVNARAQDDEVILTKAAVKASGGAAPGNTTRGAGGSKSAETQPSVTSKKGTGAISVSASPWAQVSINGRMYGTTPKTVKDLAPGRYTVVFTRGADSKTRTVTVSSGKTSPVSVEF